MSTLDPSMPWRESVRPALVAAAAFLGGALRGVADAAASVPVGPFAAVAMVGTDPAFLSALPVPGNPSQFHLVAEQMRRDLGTVRPSYCP